MRISDLPATSSLLTPANAQPLSEHEITGLTLNSREVKAGYLFIAVKGNASDGHTYIPAAIQAGAGAILCETLPAELIEGVSYFTSHAVRRAASQLAAAYYGHPSERLAVLGVTGTNGKTTTGFLIDSLIRSKFGRCGLIGTVSIDEGKGPRTATHTTPDSISLQSSMAQMIENQCVGLAIEISSHGIEQGRTADLEVNTAVFTNLTQDHLDYHGTMEAYYQAKKKLFTQLGQQAPETLPCALINTDDEYGQRLARELQQEYPNLKQLTFGFNVDADLRAQDLIQSGKGITFRLDYNGKSFRVITPMIGLFNVRNILAAIGSVVASKLLKIREAVEAISGARQVPGRMERVSPLNSNYNVFVDYAHTPDALNNACRTLRELDPGRLITVFGCGGDRDKAKRPLMAAAASQNSTQCIVTSDNPRTESPISIIKEVEAGLQGEHHLSIVDRQKAIETAIGFARNGDIILIAGKGHENYQIFGTEKIYFDDRFVARDAMANKRSQPDERPEPHQRD